MPRQKRTKHNSLYPEPGSWVIDDRQGLPKIECPEPFADDNISPRNLRDEQIAYHGLGYCIYCYIPSEKIDDIPLRKLWQKAKRAMIDILAYLEDIDDKPRKNIILKQNRRTKNVVGERLL